MNVIQQILDFTKALQPAPGVPATALHDLLVARVAEAIQQNPFAANTPPGTDPVVQEIINEGIEVAAALTNAKTRLRLDLEDLPLGTVAAQAGELRFKEFGPFIEESGRLLRFIAFHSSAFLTVNASNAAGAVGELQLLIPSGSIPGGDPRQWKLAPGTVWIQSHLFATGGTGLVGLRIAGGILSFSFRPSRTPTGLVVITGFWTLSVQPEQPPAADGAPLGDGDALTVTLPTQLDVHSNAAPVASGGGTVAGFGSELNFTLNGAPFRETNQIRFPMDCAEAAWSIDGNISGVAQFSGSSRVTASGWALPVSNTTPELIGEAVHGGSIVVQMPEGIESTFAGQQGGPSQWFAATLTFNARRVEFEALQSLSTMRYADVELWNRSTSSFQFDRPGISRLLFRSQRGGLDTAAATGGGAHTQWDLPRSSAGSPFPFDGTIDAWGIMADPKDWWLACLATAAVPDETHGIALENVYLTVHVPRKLLLIGSFHDPVSLPLGAALLLFDVNFAVPTLPDPYAANWHLPDTRDFTQTALRMILEWEFAANPAIVTHLNKQVRFPGPPPFVDSLPEDEALYKVFQEHLQSQRDFLFLLDVSSREHLFGVAMELPSDNPAELVNNRLAFQMRHLRLLMQPQVLWEPVQIEPNPLVPTLRSEIIHSTLNGGPTLVGANTVTLVPTLPELMTEEILAAIGRKQSAAALFSLPFGLKAMARLSPPVRSRELPIPRPTAITELHEPKFGELSSARQVRITARNALDPARGIPGMMRQLPNFGSNLSGLSSAMPDEIVNGINGQFKDGIPLHHADLSGYGLSSFSEWAQLVDGSGVSKVEFQVLNGRTAYEVIQFRSILYECGARVVRTVILERHNSGRAYRYDSGWVPIESGLFQRPRAFEKGAVQFFENIRRIRISGAVIPLDATTGVQPVIFDADARLEGKTAPVPFYDRPGYVEVPLPPPAPPPVGVLPPLTDSQIKTLFATKGPIGGPIDAFLRVGGTLDMQLSSIVSDFAPDNGGGVGYAVAIVGSPKLPQAGQWSVTRIDPKTGEVSPVDPHRGVPIVRVTGKPYRFREPADAVHDSPLIQHGLLMTTESSRVLFAQPFISPGAGQVEFEVPPLVADPYSLIQATGHFPGSTFALKLKEKPLFHVGVDNHWRIDNPQFHIDVPPVPGLLKGGEWGIGRSYTVPDLKIDLDSALPAPFKIDVPRSDLKLNLPQFPGPLQDILKVTGNYITEAGGLPRLDNPDIVFTGALEDAKKILYSLTQFLNLPFECKVWVTAGPGSSPSFVVHLKLVLTVGLGPNDRVEVGLGKFYGQFTVAGELEAAPTGVNRALLSVDFQGDIQQGILPPLLYAGGFFRFSIAVNETGRPTVQLGLGVIYSIGGDLIPGLISVEATIHYGYTLIPETLEPGVLLGLDAHAKLLGGLVGFSFSVEAMASIKRLELGGVAQNNITIWAQIRVAASVQVAIFVDEDVDFQTQFEQTIPVAALSLIPGVGILPALTLL